MTVNAKVSHGSIQNVSGMLCKWQHSPARPPEPNQYVCWGQQSHPILPPPIDVNGHHCILRAGRQLQRSLQLFLRDKILWYSLLRLVLVKLLAHDHVDLCHEIWSWQDSTAEPYPIPRSSLPTPPPSATLYACPTTVQRY